MKIRDINNPSAPLEKHSDLRGKIIDIFYNESINHVATITTQKGSRRGNHYHKETTQHILILEGTMEYYWKKVGPGNTNKATVKPGHLITTPPYEIHTLRFPTYVKFMVFSTGPRGGKDYESDTYKIKKSIVE